MKSPDFTACFARVFAALCLLPAAAQAHPGHAALDWFSAAPHAGHESEYAVLFTTLGAIALGLAAYWVAARKR